MESGIKAIALEVAYFQTLSINIFSYFSTNMYIVGTH